MGDGSDIDRLIELGLSRYGAGDLDGAMLMWEEALAIDPFNAQATSYVDYVRQNYELLTLAEPAVEDAAQAPFAIDEEPEYQIEIVPGQVEAVLPPAAAMISLDPIDAGWNLEETLDSSAVAADPGAEPEAPLAEPPAPDPDPLPLGLELEPMHTPVNFEDATREYHGTKASFDVSEPTHGDFNTDEHTSGFNNPQRTPAGFGNQETSVRKRDFGFVRPATNNSDEASDEATSRTTPAPPDGDDTTDEDLFGSLPTPRPVQPSEPESGEILLPRSTREMPSPSRPPAHLHAEVTLPHAPTQELSASDLGRHASLDPMLPHAPTRELSASDLRRPAHDPMLPHAPTRELSASDLGSLVPTPSHTLTRELPPSDLRRAGALDPMLTAPTRELGLRPGGRPLSNPEDEDQPTGQSDVRAIRDAAARDDGAARRQAEGTRHDIVLPFDPIAARAAQILDDVDAGAPDGEAPDDRTRRRVARLLELAADWNEAGELDKAVSAVDLALSEDPNSALGQKLITRNKDTIMSLFQAYLGDLDRTPQLAKPLQELSNAPISPRAAFLLSRIDGMLTIDELLDVSGMPRLEAYRHLCQLFLRGILR